MKQFTFIILFCCGFLICQAQNIQPAPSDKAVIYFARKSALGFAINFTYYDSTKCIGKFNGTKYFRYECAPGKHLFWAQSENREFIEAEVEGGKIYLVEVIPTMGGMKAAVVLKVVDPTNTKDVEKIVEFINSKPALVFTEEELKEETKNSEIVIARGLEKYKAGKADGKTFIVLTKEMYYR